MELLKYKEICIFNEGSDDSKKPTGTVILYQKSESSSIELKVDETFDSSLKTDLIDFLALTSASDKVGETRLFNNSSLFVALCCLGNDLTNPKLIENVRKATINGINALKAININKIMLNTTYMAKEMIIGGMLSNYSYTLLNKSYKKSNLLLLPDKDNEDFKRGERIGFYHNFVRFLADTPANLMTPTLFVEYARDILKDKKKVNIKVYGKDYMKEKNMNLLLSVSEGSEEEPKLLVIDFYGANENGSNMLALIGKGVTFDSGGISIKGSSKMGEMKADMMGAACVLATICLVSELGLPLNMNVTIPLTENMPSGRATKPGDVKIAMNGMSVEIDNTDAEGRLILGDAITHCMENNTNLKYMVDVATLTGAMRVVLGCVYMGLFTNSDNFATIIENAGIETDDLVWRMPLDKKYRQAMESNVADIKNAGSPGTGGSCTAAIFLNDFVCNDNDDKKIEWAHLDVASTMCGAYNTELYGKGMSGKPLMLLFEMCNKIASMKK